MAVFQRTAPAGRFNEAPAKHGGKPLRRRGEDKGRWRFNEAPAKHGGKPPSCA